MAVINTAASVRMGTVEAKAVYLGTTKVWPPASANTVSVTLANVIPADPAKVRATAATGGIQPDQYKFYLNNQLVLTATTPGPHEFPVAWATAYTAKVETFKSGSLLATGTSNTVTSPAAPPPAAVHKLVELEAFASASYNQSGQNRAVGECYYGYTSSVHGLQKSLWIWDIPADVRNCVSIDRIDVRVYNIHAYLNSGGSTGLVVHHGTTLPQGFPGSTGILQYNGQNWLIGTPKPGYMSQDGSGWMTNIHVLSAPGRTSLAEEFRVNGAWGMGLASPSTSTNHYGYAAGAGAAPGQKPAIKIWYTTRG
jgi:hypothetical protein